MVRLLVGATVTDPCRTVCIPRMRQPVNLTTLAIQAAVVALAREKAKRG